MRWVAFATRRQGEVSPVAHLTLVLTVDEPPLINVVVEVGRYLRARSWAFELIRWSLCVSIMWVERRRFVDISTGLEHEECLRVLAWSGFRTFDFRRPW